MFLICAVPEVWLEAKNSKSSLMMIHAEKIISRPVSVFLMIPMPSLRWPGLAPEISILNPPHAMANVAMTGAIVHIRKLMTVWPKV